MEEATKTWALARLEVQQPSSHPARHEVEVANPKQNAGCPRGRSLPPKRLRRVEGEGRLASDAGIPIELEPFAF